MHLAKQTIIVIKIRFMGFSGGPLIKNSSTNEGDMNSIYILGRYHMPWNNSAHGPQLLSLYSKSLLTTRKSSPHVLKLSKDQVQQ